MIQSFNYQRF